MVPQEIYTLILATCKYVRWPRRIKVADGSEVANELSLK